MSELKNIVDYYNDQTYNKLNDYIFGNIRIQKAWKELKRHTKNPRNILEIGCGAGYISYKLAKKYPKAQVTAIDISDKSIELAKKVFKARNLNYFCTTIENFQSEKKFDLIVLFDVYEHIADEMKVSFNKALSNYISKDTTVFFSFPTPTLLAYQRKYTPSALQPVDEDITIFTLCNFAKQSNLSLKYYNEVNIYKQGDYAHVVFASNENWSEYVNHNLLLKLYKRLRRLCYFPISIYRKILIKKKLSK